MRAILIGVPDTLATQVARAVPGVYVPSDLYSAGVAVDEFPNAVTVYGEEAFGMVTSGQPLPGTARKVLMVDSTDVDRMDWKDRRRLVWLAGMKLGARLCVEVLDPVVLESFDRLLDRGVVTP